jgi:hypothetical protein
MFRRNTRLRTPAFLLAALAALLVFAATAAAETKTGESTSTLALAATSPEATMIKGTASYDTTGGNAAFTITTAAPPQAEPGGELSETMMIALLFTTAGECSSSIGTVESLASSGSQALIFENSYAVPGVEAVLGSFSSIEGGGGLGEALTATKTVEGTATTLSASSGSLAEKSFNCALVLIEEPEGSAFMAFPIKAPVIPPAPPAAPAAPAPPAPAPAPPVLSIAKAKPLKAKLGKWKTVQLKVTNTGATATTQGSLRVKPVKGVLVKPEVQKLPILLPGAIWSVPVQVELTKKAKPSSTLALTGIASGISAKGSLVVKLTK